MWIKVSDRPEGARKTVQGLPKRGCDYIWRQALEKEVAKRDGEK